MFGVGTAETGPGEKCPLKVSVIMDCTHFAAGTTGVGFLTEMFTGVINTIMLVVF